MEIITPDYLTRAEVWICITTLMYFLMNGAQIFETLVFVPKWAKSPPQNFGLILDGTGASLKSFWIIFHSIHEITFIIAIVFTWKIAPIRDWLLILFTVHFAVRIWTIVYFAPHIIDFQKIAQTANFSANLVERIARWQKLNYVRVGIFVAISIGLLPLCMKLFTL